MIKICVFILYFDVFSAKSFIQTETSQEEVIKKDKILTDNSLLLFPNSTSNVFRVQFTNSRGKKQFDFFIYNYNGILVHSGTSKEQDKIELSLDFGIYIVKIKSENTWYTEKLMLQ